MLHRVKMLISFSVIRKSALQNDVFMLFIYLFTYLFIYLCNFKSFCNHDNVNLEHCITFYF